MYVDAQGDGSMIVREIANSPDAVLAAFDWFNDYDDTRRWCAHNAPQVLPRLDTGFKAYIKQHNAEILRKGQR